MPNRILRQEILYSDRVNALSEGAEVFYRRVMSVSDDLGLFPADMRLLRAECYPLRLSSVTEEMIESWLLECSRTLPGETEPLITLYSVGRKRYLQIKNFNQRLRNCKRKYPNPPCVCVSSDRDPLTDDRHSPRLAARATTPPPTPPPAPSPAPAPSTHTQQILIKNSNPTRARELPADELPADEQLPPDEPLADGPVCFDYQLAFNAIVDAYPPAGRDRGKLTQALFRGVVVHEYQTRRVSQPEVCEEIRASIALYEREDYRWLDGHVHTLRRFLQDELWKQPPLPVAAERARSPSNGNRAAARKKLLEEISV